MTPRPPLRKYIRAAVCVPANLPWRTGNRMGGRSPAQRRVTRFAPNCPANSLEPKRSMKHIGLGIRGRKATIGHVSEPRGRVLRESRSRLMRTTREIEIYSWIKRKTMVIRNNRPVVGVLFASALLCLLATPVAILVAITFLFPHAKLSFEKMYEVVSWGCGAYLFGNLGVFLYRQASS